MEQRRYYFRMIQGTPRQREIASRGGTIAWERGTAHKWTPEEARKASAKGKLRKKGAA